MVNKTEEELITEILDKAEKYRFQQDLIELVEKLTQMNPKMEKFEAIKIAFNHFKSQSKLGTRN